MKTKKFTILHSNDIHGDFLAEIKEGKGKLLGGLALLSGYINKVRSEEENVLYVISGDMVQGSLIDAEYKGISTMEIMNYLSPDVVALANHEFDYGLPHLLFLEKMANFPIVNANLYIKDYHKRLMRSHYIIKKAGMDILFTGIITEKIMDALKLDPLIGSFVNLEEASQEVGKICDAYKRDDIDLTILLTHIGYESDLKLAKILKPEWGVDLIVGGHSHSFLKKPAKVNGVLIVQAGIGTDQIGRLDIVVDDDTNSIVDYQWKLMPINEDLCQPDKNLEKFIDSFKNVVDKKYSVVITHLQKTLTHPQRETETEIGNLIADIFAEKCQSDIVLVGSGSIRVNKLGPVVCLKDLLSLFPYDDFLCRHEINGKQLRQIFSHIMRLVNRDGEGECYQVNGNVKAIYDDKKQKLVNLLVNNKPVKDNQSYRILMQGYHFKNSQTYLNISNEELEKSGQSKTVTTSAQEVIKEYLMTHQNLNRSVEGRLVYHNGRKGKSV
jgi:5'-nucleotidase / UDP-sugar diphosphatase